MSLALELWEKKRHYADHDFLLCYGDRFLLKKREEVMFMFLHFWEKQERASMSLSLCGVLADRGSSGSRGLPRGLPGVFRVQAGVQGSRGLDASRHSSQKSRTSHWSICFGGLSGISLLPYFDVQVLHTYM